MLMLVIIRMVTGQMGARSSTTTSRCTFSPLPRFPSIQGGIKCGNRGIKFLDSKGSHRQRRPQTYAVLSRNCICRDLRAFSRVIFPSFDRNSNIFAIFIEQKRYGQNRKAFDRTEKLSIEQKIYRQNRKAIDRHFCCENAQLRHFCRENVQLRHFCCENAQLQHFCRKNLGLRTHRQLLRISQVHRQPHKLCHPGYRYL